MPTSIPAEVFHLLNAKTVIMLSATYLRNRSHAAKEKAKMRLTQPSSWQLPKKNSSNAPSYV
ncbi:hypothetical protein GGP41_010139 [Bipolaris sorokiniana]|uniref:Uncharacterized protein n=1 Tax=Cochliobolus sativus TaxID=45130 RepID=A0A8H5ZGV3_COCSA|nr:hypothetical protein GGP41_010139 [Bipolaris sorokiniana]